MRPRRASASNGTVRQGVRLSHGTVLLAITSAVGIWMVGSLGQEISLNRSLNRQAAVLRHENASLQRTNDGYRRDIAAASSGAAAEEEARKDGYARSGEKVYVIGTPAPAKPAPTPAASAHADAGGPIAAAWRRLTGGHH